MEKAPESDLPLRDTEDTVFVQLVRKHGTALERGPGILIRNVIGPSDGISGLYEIEYWGGQFNTNAMVSDDWRLAAVRLSLGTICPAT